MERCNFNILIVGVGGQGVIRAIQILAWAALRENYRVRTAETHGMAQRGGSVASFLRFGNEIEGPLIPRGNCQIIIAFEASEAVRNFNYANSKTIFLINDNVIVPPTIHLMDMEYPNRETIEKFLFQISPNVFLINGNKEALKAGDLRTLNVFMLGVLMGLEIIPLKEGTLKYSIFNFVPKKAQYMNKIAFQSGIEKGKLIRRDLK